MNPGIAQRRRRSRWLIAAGVTAIAAAGVVAIRAALGRRATGARLQRMQKSPEWQGSHFENPQPIVNDRWAVLTLFRPDPNAKPQSWPSTAPVEPARFAAPPSSGLRVTWLGHSTMLLEIEGMRFLTDPGMERARVGPSVSPAQALVSPAACSRRPAAPRRGSALARPLRSPRYATIVDSRTATSSSSLRSAWAHTSNAGAFQRRTIAELDWWDSRVFGSTLWATPARHASGRGCSSTTGRRYGRATRS